MSFRLDHTAAPLVNALQEILCQPDAPFYAPGHKRGQEISAILADCLGSSVFRADLPELPELDNLFAPAGAIRAAQVLAADAFGAEQTWFLVNGSTCGVIAAILATCGAGDTLILPRNVHQSAIAGLVLSGAVPVFVQPEYDPVLDLAHSLTPDSVAAALAQHPDAKAVLLVSPTYYGACGDVVAIAQIAHQYSIPLLVDEAHGAHFAFHPDLPISALAAGADLTVQSTHKTLSAMTQAAMLHLQGDRVDPDRIRQALQLVQSTSPSYILLASLDAARQQMATQGKWLMQRTIDRADAARTRISQIPGLSALQPEQSGTPGFFVLDRTRLTVTVSGLGIDGFKADELLRDRFSVTAELPSLQHLTFIISLGNTQDDIEQLVEAFEQLGSEQREPGRNHSTCNIQALEFNRQTSVTPRAAFFAPSEVVPIAHAHDRISAELVCPYPPGIPVLVPGEVVTDEAIEYLQQILAAGGVISGCADMSLQSLRVLKHPKTTDPVE
ncbi:aminotransferase class I/II-fold pyridoxal phosphate-dependent enzyme [Leptolyngbya sp. FACHB-36]|uniref:aminotransferase class I/II-fold pyridoxal phosphate-dependent enzyme n=1 Tax=Leptolyngbya sp. FACHB-36 TaxID=2692808 RepID=UPI0016819645|nr:aminotransferase class I/II-fold pyridoxal phosphate-dependent enzyme [Leptolyngbya sp. FACHB-36]MBD2022582.1 aminotransferase class I/II-fold pyridoxal phosphate-dependent enzyme [Leptolyngbya sp. FACHB-36]